MVVTKEEAKKLYCPYDEHKCIANQCMAFTDTGDVTESDMGCEQLYYCGLCSRPIEAERSI